jgi:PAS domain S-box-containing protein
MHGRRILASWPIRKKLLLLTLAVFLPAATIIVASGLERREHEIKTAKDNALLMVQSLAAQQEQITIGTKQMLSTLAQLPEVQRLDAQACHRLFRDLLKQFPFYSTIGLATLDGDILASALPLNSGSVNISEQKHIKDTLKNIDFSIGEYIIGKVTKVHSIHYSYPVLDEDRNLKALVIAGFNLSGYAPFIAKTNLPEDSAVIITDHREVRLYRFPENEAAAVGTYIQKDTIEQVSGDREQGVFETTGQDGIYRVYAFKQLRIKGDSPPYAYMIAGIAKNKILHEANLKLLVSLLVLGLTALVALSFAWLFGNEALVRPINQLVAATQRLGGGEAGTRTGLLHTGDELGHLARSFDEMASLLEAKDRERRQAEEEVQTQKEILERVFESAPYIMMLVNKEGRVTKINRIGAAFSGRLKEEILGLLEGEVFNCLHSFNGLGCGRNAICSDCPVRTRVMHTFQTGEGIHEAEGCLTVRRGSSDVDVDMLVSTALLKDTDSDTVLVTIADITERKQAEKALRESELFSRSTLDALSAHIAILDEEGFIVCTNRAWDLFAEPNGLVGCDFPALNYLSVCDQSNGDWAEEAPLAAAGIREVISGGRDSFKLEYPCHSPDEKRWFNMRVTRFRDHEPPRIVVAHENITERKRAEEACRESEERYRAIVEDQTELISRFLPDGTLTFVNSAYCRYFDEPADKLIGNLFWHHVPEEDRKRLNAHIESLSPVNPVQTIEHRVLMRAGEIRWQQWTDRLIIDKGGGRIEIQAVGRDISERKRAEEALRESEKELRFLSSKLLSTQEEERKRIAGELHDGLSSSLSAIKISIENARRQLDQGRADPDLMEIPLVWTQNLIDEARRLMSELRPSLLDDVGLIATVKWFFRQYRTTYPAIHVEEEIRIAEEDVPEPLKIVIFRIAQEAFHNIAKYSRAEFASLSLVRSDGAIELVIEDSGEGFDLGAALSKISEIKGLGLTSMKERCELSGGSFYMDSSIGEGTIIRASWPVG